MKFLIPLFLLAGGAFGQSNSIQLWDRTSSPRRYMKIVAPSSLNANYTTSFDSGGSIHLPGDMYLSADNMRFFNAGGNTGLSATANGVGTHFVIYPTTGTLPADTLTEMVLYRTTIAQEAMGNVERLDFSGWLTPFQAYAIQEEALGTGQFRPLVIMAAPTENVRFQTDTTTTFGLGSATPLDTVTLQIAPPGSNGTYDSHRFLNRGFGYAASTDNNADWAQQVHVTSGAGASTWRLQTRIGGAAYVDKLLVTDTGTLTIAAGGVQMGTATQPSCAAGTRGTFWYVAGGAGVKDTVNLCTKDAADAYAWRSIY